MFLLICIPAFEVKLQLDMQKAAHCHVSMCLNSMQLMFSMYLVHYNKGFPNLNFNWLASIFLGSFHTQLTITITFYCPSVILSLVSILFYLLLYL